MIVSSLALLALTGPVPAVALAPVPAACTPCLQGSAKVAELTADEIAERIEKYLRHAQTGSAIIRPQAARKLAELGEPAAARLLELSGDSNRTLADLGSSLVEVFGQFGVGEHGLALRGLAWGALEDSEFPWRPAAARAVADFVGRDQFERLARFVDDPIAPVRFGALDGLFAATMDRAGQPKASDELKRRFIELAATRLADENDIVRHEAAAELHARGYEDALLWIIEGLKRVDSFFDMPTGEAARYSALSLLADRGIDLGEYNPELPPSNAANIAAIAHMEAEVRADGKASRAKLPKELRELVPTELPKIALAAPRVEGALIGLQLKSCRRGDYYLRWTADDVLVIGYGNPARIQLETGTTRRLVERAERTQKATGDKVYWGVQGCDMEGYHMPRLGQPKGRPQILTVSKNEQPIADLRPAALGELGAALAASIPSDEELTGQDLRTRALAERVRIAFESIGGELPALD